MHSRRRSTVAVAMLLLSLVPASASADEDVSPPGRPPEWRGWRAPAQEPEERNSTGMMVSGIILTSCGILNGANGVGFMIATSQCDGELCVFPFLAGLGFSGVGAALLAIGIPLWVVGAGEPDRDRDEAVVVPRLTVGPASVRARWSF